MKPLFLLAFFSLISLSCKQDSEVSKVDAYVGEYTLNSSISSLESPGRPSEGTGSCQVRKENSTKVNLYIGPFGPTYYQLLATVLEDGSFNITAEDNPNRVLFGEPGGKSIGKGKFSGDSLFIDVTNYISETTGLALKGKGKRK